MKKGILNYVAGFLLALAGLSACKAGSHMSVALLETTDIHGVILPYDYVEKRDLKSSLASSYTYIKKVRAEKDATVLLDNGDNLQGQPEVYYYNFIDTVSPHLMAEAFNFAGFDASEAGNHDFEAGHAVYDRLRKQYKFPLLAANAVSTATGKPYFNPYCIIRKNGLKIAVLGLVTPSIPDWLPEELYSGIEFRDMSETARYWMTEIKKQKPDLVVGLFHSGWDRTGKEAGNKDKIEFGSVAVAYDVPGFDVIFTGHDHRIANEKIVNSAGDTVLVLNGGSRSEKLAEADIELRRKMFGKPDILKITGKIISTADFEPDREFVERFASRDKVVRDYVDRKIGSCQETISSRDSYFGSSAFVDMIHRLQLRTSGADISFASPLSFDVRIPGGPVTVGDMFKLYRYENMLYKMRLTGSEIIKYLEYSYGGWFTTMKDARSIMLKFRSGSDGTPVAQGGKYWLNNQPYNFDSAAGIDYTVDLSKPEGSRIKITGFSDGRSFSADSTYTVALNSYRGNGGGGHLTEGAGLSKKELADRLISSTDRDLRYYMLKSVEESGSIDTKPLGNWKLVPEAWVREARERDYRMLFGKGN